MIKFIKKNPAIPQRWIVLTALAYSLTAAQAQTPQAEKAFIKENMEFATKQYSLMMQTPAQGKMEKLSCHTVYAKTVLPAKEVFTFGQQAFPWYIMVSIKLHRRQSFARLCLSLYTSNGTRKDLHRQS